ncbi:hypothetical protein SprV_0301161900 [Sparganum proliferum]
MNTPTIIPAVNPTMTTTFATRDQTADAPPPSIAGTIHPATTPASITTTSCANTTTSRNPPIDGTASDVLSPTTLATNTPTSSNVDSMPACPHYDRPFTSQIGLAGHLRVHRTEAGEPVSGTPTPTHIHTHRLHPPPLSRLPPHTHSPHRPIWSHTYLRQRNSPQYRHT